MMPFSEDVITIVGVLLAIPALWFAVQQLRHARADTRLQALLEAEALLDQHADVHAKLRPGGEWSTPGSGPLSPEEWISVETYMGLFERMKLAMVDRGAVSLEEFDRMYGYRVLNIDANDVIRQSKLEGDLAASWQDFIDLRDAVRKSRALPPRSSVTEARSSGGRRR